MKKVSVIIPAYNEEQTILETLRKVKQQKVEGAAFEVIVIDDGSKDNTVSLLNENKDLYTKLICQSKNTGKGGAVKEGLRHATGDYILFQDADLEYDPGEYKLLMFPALEFDSDIVMGSRCLAPPYVRVVYFWHRIGNMCITLFYNLLNNTTFTDIYSCYLMYKRELVDPDELKTLGWEQHAEILSLATKRSKVFYEVPISYHGRTYEEGKKIRAHHIIGVIWTIFLTKFFRS